MHPIIQACVLAFWLSSCAAGPAFAQNYPAKPVRMVVPFPPGGAADLIGRVLAQRLSEQIGQAVIVDNRAGASGNIGADAVAKAQADGYTILLGALTSHAINHTLERKVLRYDLDRDLSPVMIVASVPYVFVVHPSVPARSMQEFIAYARAKPGHLTYGSSGAGAPQRLAAEMFKLKTGIDMLHVPYKGSGQVINDLIGGQVLVAIESVPAALPHIRAAKLRALAVTTAQRVPMLPDVPTMGEAASFTFEVSSTFGILAPSGTPKPVIERLNTEFAQAVTAPDVKERLLQQGAFTVSTTPEEAAQRIRSEIAMWANVIDEYYHPTQPFPVKPEPLSPTSFTMGTPTRPDQTTIVRAEDTTPEHAAACRELVEKSGGFNNQGPFTPFNYKELGAPPRSTIQLPGGTGGVNWGGVAADPTTGIVFANAQTGSLTGWVEKVEFNVDPATGARTPKIPNWPDSAGSDQEYNRAFYAAPSDNPTAGKGPFSTFSANGMPCLRPPWGQLVAVNANTGDIVWRAVLGLNDRLPEGKQLVGGSGSAGPTVTAGGLVFVGATSDQRFRAFDAKSGKELWVTRLPSAGNANPMTYTGKNGKQYVAIVSGGTVNVFTLP